MEKVQLLVYRAAPFSEIERGWGYPTAFSIDERAVLALPTPSYTLLCDVLSKT